MSARRQVAGERPEATRLVARGAARLLRAHGFAVVSELTFANGRRADLVALSPAGEIHVVEVKSGLEDFRIDAKWPDYRLYCDRFYFAVDAAFPRERLPADVGVIVADGFGGEIIAHAPAHPLVGARRKAVTLVFARHAADRLYLAVDPNADPFLP